MNRIILITGSTRGIGLATARRFIASGDKVILVGRTEKALKKAQDEIGGDTRTLIWDISDTDRIATKVEDAISLYGKLDVLINCAGYLSPSCKKNDFFAVTIKEWDAVEEVNLKGVFFICQAVLKYMIDNKINGHVVNVCSEMSFRPVWYPYGCTKWGVRGLTHGLGRLMAPYGITVNGIAPGQTATEMMGYKSGDPLDEKTIPRGVMSTPDEIAGVIHFLAGDEAKNIMGDVVISDGGRHLY